MNKQYAWLRRWYTIRIRRSWRCLFMMNLFRVLLIALLTCVAHADTVILWFVEDPPILEIGGDPNNPDDFVKISELTSRGKDAGLSAEYVRMSVSGNTLSESEYLFLSYDKVWDDTKTDLYLDGSGMYAGPAYANVTKYFGVDGTYDPSLTFAIEIGNYNGQGEWVSMAVSQAMTIKDLDEGQHIFSDELQYQGSFDWGGGSYAVPEPSSGLLILIGGALLALRRRRRTA